MKTQVAYVTAFLLLVAGPAAADDDAGTSVGDDEVDAAADVSVDEGSAASDASVTDAEPDASTNDGETAYDAAGDGSLDGGTGEASARATDAAPPPPIPSYYNDAPSCSFGVAPGPAVGALVDSALVALLLVRRRRKRVGGL